MIPRLGLMLTLLPLVSAHAADWPPPACDPHEVPVVCNLKIQRDNALDELAISEARRTEEAKAAAAAAERAAAKVEYWRRYVLGLSQLP